MKDLTPVADWVKALGTNSTQTGWAALAATATKPSGAGVFEHPTDALELMIFGAGADNNTTSVRVIGWSKVGTLWVPKIICELFGTLSAFVGIAGQPVIDTDRIADAITITTGGTYAVALDAPADTPALAIVDTAGHELIEFRFNRNAVATNSNALFRKI